MICIGVIILASSILPFSITSTSAGKTMTIICTVSIWLRTIGFAVIVSALFAKTYRIHRIIRGTTLYRTSDARILTEFLLPLTVTLIVNAGILSTMIILNPVKYGIKTIQQSSTQTITYGSCIFTEEQWYHYWIPLAIWNISINAISLYLSWTLRKFDLEYSTTFPSEGQQIFNALLSSLIVSLVGMLIMQIARDRFGPTTNDLIEGSALFVFCALVLSSVFATKVKHVWTSLKQSRKSDKDNGQSQSESSPDRLGLSLLTENKTKEELEIENDGLRKRNLQLEEELILYPNSERSVSTLVRNFFGKLLGSDDDTEVATIEEMNIRPQKEQEKRLQKSSLAPKAFQYRCKQVVQDICVFPSDDAARGPASIDFNPKPWSIASSPSRKKSSSGASGRSHCANLNSYLQGSTPSKSTPNKSTPSNLTVTNGIVTKHTKSSPEISKGSTPTIKSSILKSSTSTKGSSPRQTKISPQSHSTMVTPTQLRPRRSSFYKIRGPEPEDYSSAPIENKKSSPNSDSALASIAKKKSSPTSNKSSPNTKTTEASSEKKISSPTSYSTWPASTKVLPSQKHIQSIHAVRAKIDRSPNNSITTNSFEAALVSPLTVPEDSEEGSLMKNSMGSTTKKSINSTAVVIGGNMRTNISCHDSHTEVRPKNIFRRKPPTPLQASGDPSIPEGLPLNIIVYPIDSLEQRSQPQSNLTLEQGPLSNRGLYPIDNIQLISSQSFSQPQPRRHSNGYDVDILQYRHIV